jgi:beta-galactosidase/beta-glucuronidase
VLFWWPVSYGPQLLYTFKAELFSENRPLETSLKKFGIRTVHLNQTPDDVGSSFEFLMNGRRIYVRGASWIPLSLRITPAADVDYEKMLKRRTSICCAFGVAEFTKLKIFTTFATGSA